MRLIKSNFGLHSKLQRNINKAAALLREFVESGEPEVEIRVELDDDMSPAQLHGILQELITTSQQDGDDTYAGITVYYLARYDRVYLCRNPNL